MSDVAQAELVTTPEHGQTPKKRKKSLPVGLILLALTAVACASAGAWYFLSQSNSTSNEKWLTFEARQGPLVVSVTETGTIEASEQVTLSSAVEGQATVLYLVEEGSVVAEGDLLVELDTSGMADELIDDEIDVMNAKAAKIRAEEDLAVVQNQAQSDVSVAELDLKFAKADLQKYKEGESAKLRMEAQAAVDLAQQELTQAQIQLDGSRKLLGQKFISQSEFDSDQLAFNRAKLDLDLKTEELRLLNTYEDQRNLDQFEEDLKQAEFALERAQRKARADVVQAEAEVEATASELERQEGRLARTKDQISKGKIYAPREGLVVYATSGGGGFRGNDEPLAEGQQVRERQDIINLPTATNRIAKIKIHESSLDKIRVGLPVRITVDAIPGSEYWGRVSRIAPLPDATQRWMNPDLKVYNTEITINGNGEELRTGMSCRAEIVVENYSDATFVPVQSVVRVGGDSVVFVENPAGDIEERSVEVGLDNNSMIVIKSGIQKGDNVLLNPPLANTGASNSIVAEDIPEEQKDAVKDAKANPTARPAGEGGQGGQGGQGGGDQRQAMMQFYQALNAKLTEDEKSEMQTVMQSGDREKIQQFFSDKATKYSVKQPDMSAMGGGQGRGERGQGNGERGQGSGQGGDQPANRDTSVRVTSGGSSGNGGGMSEEDSAAAAAAEAEREARRDAEREAKAAERAAEAERRRQEDQAERDKAAEERRQKEEERRQRQQQGGSDDPKEDDGDDKPAAPANQAPAESDAA